MKKFLAVIMALVFVLSLTGCSKVKLKEGESHIVIDKKGTVSIEFYMSDKDADKTFDIDTEDKVKDIKEDLEDLFDDYDIDAEIKNVKASKDYLKFTMVVEDADDYGIDLDMTLEDYADDRYCDIDELEDEGIKFYTYKSEGKDKVKSKDLEDYEDYKVLGVNSTSLTGGEVYITVPGEIVLVTDGIKFEKVSKNTIYIKKSKSYKDIIVYKD